MNAIIDSMKREPIRWFTGLQLLVALAVQGLLLFTEWDPTADQLTYIIGVPSALGAICGFTIVRNAVTPNEKLPGPVIARARDAGLSTVQLVVLIVVVIFAFFGAAHIFGWNVG